MEKGVHAIRVSTEGQTGPYKMTEFGSSRLMLALPDAAYMETLAKKGVPGGAVLQPLSDEEELVIGKWLPEPQLTLLAQRKKFIGIC